MNKYYPEIFFRTACIWRLFRKYRDKALFGITLRNCAVWYLRLLSGYWRLVCCVPAKISLTIPLVPYGEILPRLRKISLQYLQTSKMQNGRWLAEISPHSLQNHTSPDRREFWEISSFSFHSPHHRKLKTAKQRACHVSLFVGQYGGFSKTPKINAKKQETFLWFPVLVCRSMWRRLFSFFVWLFIKAELEQGSDKPPFDVVLCVFVDLSVFKGSKPDSLAVMP